mmetsp:Transcript_33741/g.49208  ORF Transcript_33741/g.49208 Transcript_33741/m.49208 type:complete len:300 (+) Transcript_33741:52-951(+)
MMLPRTFLKLVLSTSLLLSRPASALASPTITALSSQKGHHTHKNKNVSPLSRNSILNIRGGDIATIAEQTATTTATSLNAVPAWVKFCGQAAPIASVGMSMASLPTIWGISKNKSVGDLPLLPYTSLISNAFIWALYGVLQKDPRLWSCNIAAVVLGVYYFTTFTRHSPSKSPTLPGSVARHLQVCLGIITAVSAIALRLPTELAIRILGTTGVVICIGLFASPLAALKTVLKTKSAQSIPLPFAVATAINCFFWTTIGVLDMKDINIWLPNTLGFSCALAQVFLKIIYGGKKDAAEAL